MNRTPPIWVEIVVRTDLDELWRRTQEPALHERWDLRFTHIEYLPRPDPTLPQRFRYATRIGFGLGIEGAGESIAARTSNDGVCTSSLRFWSEDSLSLIREGAGYWKYEPLPGGAVRFVTGYDYEVRGGAPGRIVDRLLFRPLLGWATAWSFDRLRLWLEHDIAPEQSFERSLVHAAARGVVALTFLWHGLVPKLLLRDPTEAAPLLAAGLSPETAWAIVTVTGVVEMVWAVVVLATWRRRWPLLLTAIAMIGLLAGVAVTTPVVLAKAFNPLTLNVAVAALAMLGWQLAHTLPSAARCGRRPAQGTRAVAEAAAAAAADVTAAGSSASADTH